MTQQIKFNNKQVRVLDILSAEVDTENKDFIKISFSSETPYPRVFGVPVLEVIGHDEGDMNLEKLNNKAAVLFNHNFDDLIGVVEKSWIEEKVGYALIRLSSTAEKFKVMVQEKILNKVSFGYEITDMVKIGEDMDGTPIVKVKTIPYEVSLVSVPADDTVGVIRSLENRQDKGIEITIEIDISKEDQEEIEDMIEEIVDTETVDTQPVLEDNLEVNSLIKEKDIIEDEKILEKKLDNDFKISENNNTNNFYKGNIIMKEILALGRSVGEMDLAVEFVEAGKSLEQFKDALIDKKTSGASKIDAGTQSEVRKFSLSSFLAEQAEGKEGYMTGFAREMGQDFAGRKSRGGFILPKAVFARDYAMGGNAAATSGQDFRAQVFANLYNNSVVLPLINRLPDATGFGSVKYPKLNGKNSFQFLGENTRADESNATFSNVVFTPKTIGGRIVLSRDIMKQSSIMIDNIAKNELLLAKDEFVDNALLNGDGINGWTGIFNTVGAEVVEMGTDGGAIDFAKVVEFGSRIDSANAHTAPLTFITNSKVVGAMKTTQKFANYGGAILENGMADGYSVAVSNQVASDYTKGTGTGLSGMALINGSMANYMEWDGYELIVNPYRLGAGQVEVELFLTADFQVSNPEGIVLAKDIAA